MTWLVVLTMLLIFFNHVPAAICMQVEKDSHLLSLPDYFANILKNTSIYVFILLGIVCEYSLQEDLIHDAEGL